jgi:hypothetical protein
VRRWREIAVVILRFTQPKLRLQLMARGLQLFQSTSDCVIFFASAESQKLTAPSSSILVRDSSTGAMLFSCCLLVPYCV